MRTSDDNDDDNDDDDDDSKPKCDGDNYSQLVLSRLHNVS